MSIFKDSKSLITTSLILLVISLATGVMTARLLGTAGKGEFYLILQFSSLASLVLSGGLGPSYQYHLKRGLLDRSEVLSHMLSQSFGVTLLLLGFALSIYLPQGIAQNVIPRSLVFPIVFATILNLLALYTNSLLMTVPTWISTSSRLSVMSSVSYVFLLAAFVWGFEWGVTGAVAAYLISLFVKFIPTVLYLVMWRPIYLRPVWIKHSPTLFAFGISSFLSNVVLSSVFRVDVFIVNSLVGVAAVGIYSVAVSFAEMALMAPSAIGVALFAHLPGSSDEEQIKIVGRSMRVTVFLAFIGGVILAAISHPLVTLSMGEKFSGAVVPLIILIPGLVMMSANYVFSNYYASQGKPIMGAYCFGIGLVINVIINFIAIPRMGIEGAALASSVSYSAITVCFFVILRHQHGLGVKDLFILNREDIVLVARKFPLVKYLLCFFDPAIGKG